MIDEESLFSPCLRDLPLNSGINEKIKLTMAEDDDEFWNIALSISSDRPHQKSHRINQFKNRRHDHNEDNRLHEFCDSDSDSCEWDGVDEDDDDDDSRIKRYHLPTTSVTLEMRPLPPNDGVWSPVGGSAWYSSSLLASMLLCVLGGEEVGNGTSFSSVSDNAPSKLKTNNGDADRSNESLILLPEMLISNEMSSQKSWNILELGSGAVALSGMATAVAMSRYRREIAYTPSSITAADSRGFGEFTPKNTTIFLTDNDPPVLSQLRTNVNYNQHHWTSSSSTTTKNDAFVTTNVQVKSLDWSDPSSMVNWVKGYDGIVGIEDPWPLTSSPSTSPTIDLVIGSELVYTKDTAIACASLLVHLLETNPELSILIVQVTDRYGWEEVLVPKIHDFGASIQPLVLSTEIHDAASTMIFPGGTLDRHAYGAVLIRNRRPPASS